MLQDIGMGEDISKKTSVAEVDKCDIELKGKKKPTAKKAINRVKTTYKVVEKFGRKCL